MTPRLSHKNKKKGWEKIEAFSHFEGNRLHNTKKRKQKHLIENYLSECQILSLAANNFKAAIINMFKKVKETIFKVIERYDINNSMKTESQ